MTIIIIIVAIILLIIAIPLLIALFLPGHYFVERSVNIKQNATVVFNYLRILRNQENFSVWVMKDPDMKREFTGTDGTVGFIYAWESMDKGAGKGEQEIKQLIDEKRVDTEVRFEKPFKSVAQTPFIIDKVSENETNVTWSMIGNNRYPMNLMNLFMDKLLGRDMDQSLSLLKKILEEKQH